MSAKRKDRGSDYYYLEKSQSPSLWKVIGNVLLVLTTLALAAALVMAYLSRGISPADNWVFAFFGLVAPFLYLGNFVMLLIWVIRWKGWFLVSLVTLLCGVGYLGTLVQVDIKRDYAPVEKTDDIGDITVMTYNVHGFSREQKDHDGYLRMVDSVAAYVQRVDPDIICFQEYETMHATDVAHMARAFMEWPYRTYNFIHDDPKRDSLRVGYGVAIFSRFPIADAKRMRFSYSGNSMLYADILIGGGDTVRVFNNHLQSNQIDDEMQRRVERLDVTGGNTEQFVRGLGSQLKRNYKRRALQVDTVSQMVRSTHYPVIVAGDFNDTPLSYTYKKMRGDLKDPFMEVGSGFAYTYNRLFSMLRIDYIFNSPYFDALAYRSDNLPWSDHNPVVVRFQKTTAGSN